MSFLRHRQVFPDLQYMLRKCEGEKTCSAAAHVFCPYRLCRLHFYSATLIDNVVLQPWTQHADDVCRLRQPHLSDTVAGLLINKCFIKKKESVA